MRIRAICFVTLLGLGAVLQAAEPLPPLRQAPPKDVNLLRNSGFEDPQSKAWRFSDWPPRPKTRDRLIARSVFYAQDVIHSGAWAVGFDHTTVGADRTLSARQMVAAETLAAYDGRRMRLSGWIWVAQGPSVYRGTLGMRQWGKRGAPPFGGCRIYLTGKRGEWTYCKREFTFRLGNTKRADVNLWLGSLPDTSNAPVCYVDDVRLEVLAAPELAVELLAGKTLFAPDRKLPLRVTIADSAWQKGMRCLRWDVTSPDGLQTHAHRETALGSPLSIVEAQVPALAEGDYALRLALASQPHGRDHETLVSFRIAKGPFAR